MLPDIHCYLPHRVRLRGNGSVSHLKCRSAMVSMHAAYRAKARYTRSHVVAPQTESRHGKDMEMHQVRYFLAVADTLNFTRAAEQCHVSQPALTRAIQQLEEELGGLLLRRERKLTHLTDFGQLIEPHLRQLAADAEAAKTTAKRFLNLQQADIRLGVMCTIGPARFMGFLAGSAGQPRMRPDAGRRGAGGTVANAAARELDLVVMAQPERSTNASISFRSIGNASASPSRPDTVSNSRTASGPTSPARPICAGSTAISRLPRGAARANTGSPSVWGFRVSARIGSR